ncbi:hypothetical protein MAPG_06671 [Magnaporthiopsis poae ATCC 64411]|uniref:Uncharacterized protein n=1 Tax=Magnaporthiopsis poae (strain ATCC 64411 / 73-15) TaxID=644358 RepID=A0A0C4E2N1_MAGP6|nr:hypothetical protein MAPG_06671 [Magnaporthiopsis poae ATCC 64411]
MKVSTILGFFAFGTALAKREPVVDLAVIPILQPLADLLASVQIYVGVITTEVGNIGTITGSGVTPDATEQVKAAVPKIKTQLDEINSALKSLPKLNKGSSGRVGPDGAAAALDLYGQLFSAIAAALDAVNGLDANRIGGNNFNLLTGTATQLISSLGLVLDLGGLLGGLLGGIL